MGEAALYMIQGGEKLRQREREKKNICVITMFILWDKNRKH